jgi:uncharacterized protein (DUF305 family)
MMTSVFSTPRSRRTFVISALSVFMGGVGLATCATPRDATADTGMTAHAHAADSTAAMGGMGVPGMSMPGMDMPVTIPKGAMYTVADVHFMQGMIGHHGQAIYMARLAAKSGADPRLLRFAMKIDQSQRGEISLMQEWLLANQQTAPDTNAFRTMSMPGMLTAAQLTQLEAARGPAFDRLFLHLMIQHHEGALSMVKDLFAAPLAGQEVDISVFANDVQSVQTAEIGLMQQMLQQLPSPPAS